MVDIVERLRRKGERVGIPCPDGIEGCLVYHFKIKTDPDCAEAADEIERLREDKNIYAETIYELEKDVRVKNDQIERLREALKEIDKAIETWLPDHSPMRQALQNFTRSALQQKETE